MPDLYEYIFIGRYLMYLLLLFHLFSSSNLYTYIYIYLFIKFQSVGELEGK